MPELYLIIVILLFILAVSDLIVGVSNDAVNFLNSAIGSKVAPRHIIMIVASIGIFVGATFSSGMMEVARKGIFNPEFFFFGEIMVIFLAVMLTDIILLDFFNTLGLPTSTTVSIVFELLGAAFVMSIIKISANSQGFSALGDYINTSQALMIVSGIFLSVIFAFLIGSIVQFFSRLIFTFEYKARKKVYGAIWTGVAMTAMTYFLLLKGMKGASFASDELLTWIKEDMYLLLLTSFVAWTIIMFFLALMKVDIFKIIVLFGTFALAMAFAGNDLVNFIGVPIAGYESYLAWSVSGQDAFSYSMEVLREPVRTKSYLLIIAGLIMITTLWFSRKARSVTETEVNLGRQDEGHERFSPNVIARRIVKSILTLGNISHKLLPASVIKSANQSFQPANMAGNDRSAFDLIRAGVNLTTASILIAFATSLKLPLSTTYVSFMVAMGTSLSDRAWGRDSAVYRVSGVLNVIGGWFATAAIAFVSAGIFTLLIYYFNVFAIIALIGAAVFFIYRSFGYHKKKEKKKEARVAFDTDFEAISFEELLSKLSDRVSGLLESLKISYDGILKGLIHENEAIMEKAEINVMALVEKNEDFQYELYQSIKRINERDSEGSRMFVYVYDLEQDIVQSVQLLLDSSNWHVKNLLNPLKNSQIKMLTSLRKEVKEYLTEIDNLIKSDQYSSRKPLKDRKKKILQVLEKNLAEQIKGIKNNEFRSKNSRLMFNVLLETKDIIAVASRFGKLYHRAYKSRTDSGYLSFSSEEDPA